MSTNWTESLLGKPGESEQNTRPSICAGGVSAASKAFVIKLLWPKSYNGVTVFLFL